jgi:hypothetical protein
VLHACLPAWSSFTAGANNAYSTAIRAEIDTVFSELDFFSFGEIDFTPTFKNFGQGRYAFGLWHMDARSVGNLSENHDVTFIVDQNLTENLQIFSRYLYSDGALTNLKHSAQLGIGYSGFPGRANDFTVAAGMFYFRLRSSF